MRSWSAMGSTTHRSTATCPSSEWSNNETPQVKIGVIGITARFARPDRTAAPDGAPVKKGATPPAFRVLADLARLVARGLPLDQLLAELCERICELLEADGSIAVLKTPPLRVAAKLPREDAERLATRPGTPERIDKGGES